MKKIPLNQANHCHIPLYSLQLKCIIILLSTPRSGCFRFFYQKFVHLFPLPCFISSSLNLAIRIILAVKYELCISAFCNPTQHRFVSPSTPNNFFNAPFSNILCLPEIGSIFDYKSYCLLNLVASHSTGQYFFGQGIFNLQAPRFLYIGQTFRFSPENAFYIFNQQIYFII